MLSYGFTFFDVHYKLAFLLACGMEPIEFVKRE